jgi:hypothetical protein
MLKLFKESFHEHQTSILHIICAWYTIFSHSGYVTSHFQLRLTRNGVDTHQVRFGEYNSVRDFVLPLDLQYSEKTTQDGSGSASLRGVGTVHVPQA